MPSYTDMARNAPAATPPLQTLLDPVLADQWFRALPARAQDLLKSRLTAIVRSMPPVAQLALRRAVAAGGHSNPIPTALDGVGHYHQVTVGGSKFVTSHELGLGMWGSIISGVLGAGMQVGGSLYNAREEGKLARDLQSNALATDVKLQQAALDAQRETQLALIAAQTEAARIAGGASVARAQINAPAFASALRWGGLTMGVAVAGLGAYFILRRKKK